MVSNAEIRPVLPPQWCQWPPKPKTDSAAPEVPLKPSAAAAPRYKVVDGALFVRHTQPYRYIATIHTLNHGQVEAGLRPRYAYSEVGYLTPQAIADHAECLQNPVPRSDFEQAEEDKANRVRATRRARSEVRRRCKHQGLVEILTLTYRENQTDRARMAHDLDLFLKRVRRVIPNFEYVCVFEKQKRGAWHAHLAVQRVLPYYWKGGQDKKLVKSFDLLRSMWRGVVGANNGNIDVSKRKKERWSPAKIAGYISKYIGKSFGDNLKHENSYSASNGALPPPIRYSFETALDGIAGLYALLSLELENADIHTQLFPDTSFWLGAAPRAG